MKKLLAACVTIIILTGSSQLFAGCYEAGRFTQCASCDNSSPYVTECQCTDPNVIRHNPCMTTEKFCENFGNVGAR